MTYNSLSHIFRDWLCHLATFIIVLVQKSGQVTNPIVKNMHVIQGFKSIFDKVTS